MSPNAERTARIHALDGLRGYASLTVVFFHSILIFVGLRPEGHRVNDMLVTSIWTTPRADLIGRLVICVLNGQTAVLLFFAISGAVLLHSMRAETPREWMILPFSFTARRILRIYPALIGCLIGLYCLSTALNVWWPAIFSRFTARDFLENATLYAIPMHGASWTLQIEMIAIPFLLLAFALKRRFGVAALVAIFCYSILVRENAALSLGSASAYLWMPSFAAGMLAAHFAKSGVVRETMTHGRWVASLFLLIFIGTITNPAQATQNVVEFGAAFLLVAHIMSGEQSSLTRFLSRPTSQYLGRISYSLYLWNVPFLYVAARVFTDSKYGEHYLSLGLATGAVITILTIPFAHFSERYLERSHKWFVRRLPTTRLEA
jgi:peptidoglycan/LPS O-acetylase OafA/YrhL